MAVRSERAGDAHDEVAEGIVELLDVRQDAHGPMVLSPSRGRPISSACVSSCMQGAEEGNRLN
jgi:hypothetical protein